MEIGTCGKEGQREKCRCLVHYYATTLMKFARIQLETVRQELERTRGRLSETETENERMRVVTNGDHREISHNGAVAGALSSAAGGSSEAELDRLRKTLQEAERDIWSKQEEIEALTKKLDYSVGELSDTETVLSTSLHDFDSERAKFSTLSEDWSRRVNAMERQLRETIRRLDERERELMNERSPDQQKFKEISQQQRRRVGTATTGNENLVAQLESKLAESEAKVVTLTQKLHDMEANSIRNNGVSGQSASSSALSKVENHLDGKKMTSSEDGESEIRFDSLRHYCHDQNRRLLATLKNETEFLQTMVESKLTAVSNSNRVSAAAELKELSDDLIAVHQYIGEIDRHLQPTEKSPPNDFMKDFNFKDVLNRLVEVQERFASLSKRDDATSMVRDPASSDCLENGGAVMTTIRMPNLVHDSHESNGPVLLASTFTNTNQDFEPALPFSTYWNYSVSVLHADLARSLASYLERKYNDSTQCTVLTSEDFGAILTETMALEACLLTEIANVIEASKNEERLRVAVKLRDIRNSYVVLRRLDDYLNDAGDDRRILAILENRLDVNFFNILCEETKRFVGAQMNDLIATLPSNWREKLRFGPADSDARVAALKALSKNLLQNSIVFESNNDETTACSMELLRSTILKDEITHILSRVETNLDAFDSDSLSSRHGKDSSFVVVEAAVSTVSLCDQMMEKLDQMIAKMLDHGRQREDGDRKPSAETLKIRLSDFLKNLKQSNAPNGATPLNTAGSKMAHIDGAFQKEIDDAGSMDVSINQSDLVSFSNLLSARAIVRGYRSWIDSVYSKELRTPRMASRKNIDFHQPAAESEFEHFLATGSKLADCVAHYEPLTKQLFYRILSNVGTKLVAVQLSVFYECRMREMASAQENLLQRALDEQRCEWCGNGKATISDRRMPDGSSASEESESYHCGNEARLRSKEELDQWRRLVPSNGNCGAPTNLAGEVAELEQEILEMQSYHNEELESLRAVHATEVEALRRELANEQERRRKLYNDMESMKAVTDHSLATLERAHGQLIEEIRDEHRREMQRLTREYDKSLMEEKEATRQALDALQKAHESELHKQAEKLMHKLTSRYSSSEEEEDGGRQSTGRHDLQDALQTISRELSDVSAAFSAKCVENSRMEDELEDTKKILDQMTSGVPLTDDQMRQQLDAIFQRSQRINTLQAELQARDTDLRCYEDRVRQLESDLTETQNALASMKAEKKNDFVGITAVTPESSLMQSVPIQNGHGEHGASSSSSSEELDDEDEEDDLAAEYQPKIARRRRGLPTSRRDSRYHSTPNLGSGDSSNPQGVEQRTVRGSPDRLLQELRNVMGMSVSERRKYFENLSKPATV